MPIYVFQCASCDKKFEELVASDKADTVRCPDCGKAVSRVWQGSCVSSPSNCKGGSSCSGNCGSCCGCHH